ncbi:MAG: hypothetical protein P1P84_25130, partial [Deferrisomatales bacterium]|nr:hypothetical protein [Deferrisomatales bacterium]
MIKYPAFFWEKHAHRAEVLIERGELGRGRRVPGRDIVLRLRVAEPEVACTSVVLGTGLQLDGRVAGDKGLPSQFELLEVVEHALLLVEQEGRGHTEERILRLEPLDQGDAVDRGEVRVFGPPVQVATTRDTRGPGGERDAIHALVVRAARSCGVLESRVVVEGLPHPLAAGVVRVADVVESRLPVRVRAIGDSVLGAVGMDERAACRSGKRQRGAVVREDGVV